MVGFIALLHATLVDNHPATRKSCKGVLLHGVYTTFVNTGLPVGKLASFLRETGRLSRLCYLCKGWVSSKKLYTLSFLNEIYLRQLNLRSGLC